MKRKAFTLIELLIVLAIVAILARMAVSSVQAFKSKSNPTQTIAQVAAIPDMPATYVTDTGGVLSDSIRHSINEQCAGWDTPSGGQLLVFIGTVLPEGEDIESYSQKLFKQWKPGDKGKNRGVLFVLFTQSRKMRIHTGYGMEAELTDAACKRILDEKVKPHLKSNKWEDGIQAGVNEIIRISTPSTASAPVVFPEQEKPMDVAAVGWGWLYANVVVIVLALTAVITWLILLQKKHKAQLERELKSHESETRRLAREHQIEVNRLEAERAELQSEIDRLKANDITKVSGPKMGQRLKTLTTGAAVAGLAMAAVVGARSREDSRRKENTRPKRDSDPQPKRDEPKRHEQEDDDYRRRNDSPSFVDIGSFVGSSDSGSSSSDSSPSCGGGDSGGGGSSSDF